MAEKNIIMQRKTATGFDTYYPKTKVELVAGAAKQADLVAHLADYVPFKDRTNMNILNLAIETEVLKGAVLTGITANIYIETFQDATDVDILQGYLIPGEGITG